jgi:hypothetical protein
MHFIVDANPLVDVASAIALIATVFAAVYHAEVIAHRVGEPFGTGPWRSEQRVERSQPARPYL